MFLHFRCFVLIEMSTVEDIAEQDNLMIENMSARENMLGMGMLSTVQTVLMQSSPKLFEVSIHSSLKCMWKSEVFLSIYLFVTLLGNMVINCCFIICTVILLLIMPPFFIQGPLKT